MQIKNYIKEKNSLWELSNPILKNNEIGISINDENEIIFVKVGNGINTWKDLPQLNNNNDNNLIIYKEKLEAEINLAHEYLGKPDNIHDEDTYLPL